jgi:hypothetical protein
MVSGFTIVSAWMVFRHQTIQPNKDQAIQGAEGQSLRQVSSLDVKLMM